MKLEELEHTIDAAFEDAGALTPDTQGDTRDAVDAALAGPLLVEDQHSSLFIPPGWTLRRVAGGALIADHDG